MLDLDTIRAEFAAHLAANASQRWQLDASIAHVVELAYRRGLDENAARVADLEATVARQDALITAQTIRLAEGEVSAMRKSRR